MRRTQNMTPAAVLSRTPRRLRFLLYNTVCEVFLPEGTALPDWADGVLEAANAVARLLNVYDPSSELSVLNRLAGEWAQTAVPVCGELFRLLSLAQRIAQASRGAFDITVRPLVELWDFAGRERRCPAPDRIRKAQRRCGYRHLQLDAARQTVSFALPSMKLDAGALGKGYAACKIAERLRGCGVRSASIDLGGGLTVLGAGWRCGIQRPWAARGEVIGTLPVSNESVSTSGGYERFFVEDGRVYHHLLDPRTGYPADTGLLSATVFGASPLLADILSTVLFVAGETAGQELLQQFGDDVSYLLIRADGSLCLPKAVPNRTQPACKKM